MIALLALSIVQAGPAARPAAELIAAAEQAIPKAGRAPIDFIPPGWEMLSGVAGDLNGDGRPDRAMTLGLANHAPGAPATVPSGEDCFEAPALVVVLYSRGGAYRLGGINHGLYPRNCELAVPYPQIRNGVLIVNLNWRDGWAVDTTFRFRANASGRLMLTGYDFEHYSRSNINAGRKVSENYLTGRRISYAKPDRSVYAEKGRTRIPKALVPFEQVSLEEDGDGADFRPFKGAAQ